MITNASTMNSGEHVKIENGEKKDDRVKIILEREEDSSSKRARELKKQEYIRLNLDYIVDYVFILCVDCSLFIVILTRYYFMILAF